MTKIYACLVGEWVCLNDDPHCVFSDFNKEPYLWWKEGAPIYTQPKFQNEDGQLSEDASLDDSFYYQNYVNITYKNKNYRINPIFIQIVTE